MTEPIPGPTAMMLLALQGHDEPRVDGRAPATCANAVAPMTDLEHLGWAKLALACHADDPASPTFLPRARRAHPHGLRGADGRRPAGQRPAARPDGAGPGRRDRHTRSG